MIIRTIFVVLALFSILTMAQQFTPTDLIQLPRPSVPVISPNGHYAVYAQSAYSIADTKTVRNLYLLSVHDNSVQELTKPAYDISDNEPFFLDDKHVAYFHHNTAEKVDQIYVLDLSKKDQAPYQLTKFPIAFGSLKYNVDHKLLAFSASVYGSLSMEETLKKDEELESTKKDTALAFDELMVRHWDTYVTEKKNTIFVIRLSIEDGKYKIEGEPINLLKGTGLESPTFPQGDAGDYDISADASQIAFVSKINTKDNAWQTSAHIYTISTDGKGSPVAVNKDIPASSSGPHYTSSGQLVYFQMMKPQYESDRNRIVIYNPETKERKVIAESWDRSPHEVTSSLDAATLYVTAEEQGRNKIFAIDIESETIEPLTQDKYATGLQVLPSGNIFCGVSSMKHPFIAHVLNVETKEIKALTIESGLAKKLESTEFADAEDVWFTGALNQQVHGWYLKPTNFEEGKKYPVAFLIHGGPQGAWNDNWSTRWNPQIFAGAGYGVVAINFHGSTGYGQNFTDSIANNWGSHPFFDLETGLDHVLEKYSYLDSERVAGLGGSYGGFMANWINGHSKKFKALVNHDGVFSTTQVYYTTDELYFAEHEFGGSPIQPENRHGFEKWSPANYVQNWKTPTLIIHGKNNL
ncbi:Alpha/Beta hydrolase protein [Thamnidium elegans]|nr:Alpha/Beta hydrolase protein [Thamnidium elegans]